VGSGLAGWGLKEDRFVEMTVEGLCELEWKYR